MKTKTIKIYGIRELSESAQIKAWEKWLGMGDCYFWEKENQQSLEAFEKLFPISIKGWSYGGRGTGVSWYFTGEEEIEDLSYIRLLKYLMNNYYHDIFTPKYISKYPKHRYSKCQREYSCPLTGYHADHFLLDPIINFLQYPHRCTFHELLEDCLQSWASGCENDLEDSTSLEAFIEHAEGNEYEFTEEGNFA